MSNRRLDIRSKMAELQKEFAALNAEVKEIDAKEAEAKAIEKFKDYKFKVGTHKYLIEDEEKIADITDDDRADADLGASGLAYTGLNESRTYGYVLLREKADYARTKSILIKLDAVENLKDEKVKDKEKFLKILLGEVDHT